MKFLIYKFETPMTHERPSFTEDHISQIPALLTLIKLWREYITPLEALQLRWGKHSAVVLEDVLRKQLHAINTIQIWSKRTSVFSDANIQSWIRAIKEVPFNEGYISASEYVYNLLTLWKTVEQSIDWDKKSYNLQYIDWKNIENNVFYVTQEFSVLRAWSNQSYRPDIVLFVNWLPLCVIECKRPDIKDSLAQSISQHIRNQQETWIRQLYVYSQINLWINTDDGIYSTTWTPEKFWWHWREKFSKKTYQEEEKEYNERLHTLKNTSLPKSTLERLFSDEFYYSRKYFEDLHTQDVLPSTQDKYLMNLCRPERFMELIFGYIVYEWSDKKICRYQQYFAVKKTKYQITAIQWWKRPWWVIWHTQWSWKSLTMVMLAQAITSISNIPNAKIIIVTDRTNLDKQISDTFKKCNIVVHRAKTWKNLADHLKSKSDAVVTTIVNKFETAVKKLKQPLESPNIFVLIDEWHRTQYGTFNIQMQKALPNACFIAFTGTPLTKKQKSTSSKFGGIIDAYTVREAVDDKAVVPLLYEWRHAYQDVNHSPINRYFERIADKEQRSDKQKADLKRKFSRADQLNQADQKIYAIARDISIHFEENRKGTWFKWQLVCPRKSVAIQYKKYLDDIGLVTSEVVITSPDDREWEQDVFEDSENIEKVFWKSQMAKYGNATKYEDGIVNKFKNGDEPEIIIVVDKFLTWFDVPKNVVLYLTRNLKEHTLLQAIARVNRVAENKEFGYIIDYYGVLWELDSALNTYSALAWFDEDVNDSLIDIDSVIDELPQKHTDLWKVFVSIQNKRDLETFEQVLSDQAIRDEFYTRLRNYAKTLKIALSSLAFHDRSSQKEIDSYKQDLSMFYKLRKSVASRYSDEIDYKKHEKQIQKLIDTHVTTTAWVTTVVESVNIFEKEKFEKELEKATGTKAKADTIASRTSKYIDEKFEQDPAFYKKFSDMLQETIDEYKQRRISEAEYLLRVEKIMNDVLAHNDDSFPDSIAKNSFAKAIYWISTEFLNKHDVCVDDISTLSLEISKKIDEIFHRYKIVNRKQNKDSIDDMKLDMFDFIYDDIKKPNSLEATMTDIDLFVEKCLWIAKLQH